VCLLVIWAGDGVGKVGSVGGSAAITIHWLPVVGDGVALLLSCCGKNLISYTMDAKSTLLKKDRLKV
jgi:hypothetical protein